MGKQDGLAPIQDAASQAAEAAAATDPVDPTYRAKATEAAVKFESFFISHMLHQMRNSGRALQEDDSGQRDKTNDDMLDMADNLVADQMAGRRAFGVADAILRQLLPPPAPAATPPGAALPLHPTAAPMPLSEGQRKVLPDIKSSPAI
ncbi:MAG: rod-binding protein [Burkholderiaceae bacterium]|nr:rod-binding protein [Burkholderiaceae bacterium]